MTTCVHCGTEFSPSAEGENFCCRGCEFVHRLITEEGFGRFYDLQAGNPGRPVRDRPFQPVDFSWLETAARDAEAAAGDGPASLRLHVGGISCVGCVWLIEKLFLRHPGGLRADVFPANGRLELRWEAGACDLPAFARELRQFGYALDPWSARHEGHDERRALTGRLGLCGAFALNAMVFTLPRYLGMDDRFAFAGLFEIITLVSATFALLVGGSYFMRRAWSALRQGVLHIDLPIALGILLAFGGSLAGWAFGADRLLYFDFVAVFTFLMLGGRYLHLSAAERVRGQMRGQNALRDRILLADGGELPLEDLDAGRSISLRSGEVLPVTALLEDSAADFSLAWITGEPEPVGMRAGRRVPAGAVNLNRRAVRLRTEEAWKDSLVSALAEHTESSGRSILLEKILRVYLAVVLALAVAGGVAWGLLAGPLDALQVAISICVVSCPCALGIAIPLADQRAAAAVQRMGVFIQGTGLWERLRRVRHLLLDKTGTLTLEHPQLRNPAAVDALRPESRRALAALAAGSLHPLSRSLLEALGGPGPAGAPVPEEIPGRGVRVVIGGAAWSLGRPGWNGDDHGHDPAAPLACELRRDGVLVERFTFAEAARPDARESLQALRAAFGIDSAILSGDGAERVRRLAAGLGLDPDHAHGGLSPSAKEELVRTRDRQDTLYLGDGANDSLAFDAAYASGTPLADRSVLDRKADFFFTSRGLGFLPPLFETARWRGTVVRRIFAFAIAYNLAAVTLCLAGLMNPLLAAILMPLSSLACLALAAHPLPPLPPPRPAGSAAIDAAATDLDDGLPATA